MCYDQLKDYTKQFYKMLYWKKKTLKNLNAFIEDYKLLDPFDASKRHRYATKYTLIIELTML